MSMPMQAQLHGATVAMAPRENPYKVPLPFRDWQRDDNCDFFYNNNYITGVRGKQEA